MRIPLRRTIATLLALAILASLALVWATPASTDLNQGLAGRWSLEEGSGTVTADTSGNANDGTLLGSPAWTTGQVGSFALDFAGAGDRVEVPGSASIDNLDAFTIAFWFNADGTGENSNGRFVVKDGNFQVRFSSYNSRIYFDADRFTTDGTWRMIHSGSLLGDWHHLAISFDYNAGTPTPSFYLDGMQTFDFEVYSAPAGGVGLDTGPLVLGNNAAADRGLDGRLDEVLLYARELSSQEVADLFAGIPPDETPPTAPGNLVASAAGQAVDLTWDAASDPESGVASYNVYRGLASGPGKSLVANVTGTTHQDQTTDPDTTYYYEVTAVNGAGGEGPASNEDSATTGNTAPGAPQNLQAVGADAQVDLDWDDNPEGDLAHYNVYRSLVSGGPYTLESTGSAVSAFADTGVTNGTTYYYVVTAEDTIGQESPPSIEASATPSETLVLAVIGDFGDAGPDEEAVADLVKSWNPDHIVTTGDNNYPDGAAGTIDDNIGQYYHEFIHPYTGGYGPGAATNRFWPSLGNHDWNTGNVTAHEDYFTLPGNERYYDVEIGPVHIFVVDSDSHEPDGRTENSAQAAWLQAGLAASTAEFQFVFMHHPPYSSSSNHGNQPELQWPYAEWGADGVFAGHDHVYERVLINGIPYFVSGNGGRSLYAFGTAVPGSKSRYNADFGAMRIEITGDQATFESWSVSAGLVDQYVIHQGCP